MSRSASHLRPVSSISRAWPSSPAICAPNGVCVAPGGAGGVAMPEQDPQVQSFGFPRDTFWPRSALAFVVVGVVLTLISAQLVAPTRRFRLFRRWGRRPARLPALAPAAGPAQDAEATPRSDAASEASPLDPDPGDRAIHQSMRSAHELRPRTAPTSQRPAAVPSTPLGRRLVRDSSGSPPWLRHLSWDSRQ